MCAHCTCYRWSRTHGDQWWLQIWCLQEVGGQASWQKHLRTLLPGGSGVPSLRETWVRSSSGLGSPIHIREQPQGSPFCWHQLWDTGPVIAPFAGMWGACCVLD